MATQSDKQGPKSSDTEAIRTIRSAESLRKDSPINIPPQVPGVGEVDLVGTMARQIMMDEAERAANIAKSGKIESELKVREASEKLSGNQPKPVQPSIPSGGLFGGFGSGSRAAIIQTIINSIPESERADFIKENKEMLLSDASLSSVLGSAGKHGGQVSSGMEAAAMLSAMGENMERMLMLQRSLNPAPPQQPVQQPVQPQVQPGAITPMDLMKLLQDQNTQSLALIKSMQEQFVSSIKAMQDQVKSVQDESRANSMTMQEKILAAKEEAFRRDQERLLEKIDELKVSAQSTTPEGVLTIQHVPMLKQMFEQVGMKVESKNAMSEENKRKWDIEDRKIDLMTAREQRAHEENLARLERQTALLGGLKEIVRGAGIDDIRVEKAIKEGGSEKARSATERF